MEEKRWNPEKGEMYWYVWNDGSVCWGIFTGASDERRFKSGNCFKTEAEAEAAAEKVTALFLSFHVDDENLQSTCNNLATDLQDKKLPDWCKVGSWVYTCNGDYRKIERIEKGIVSLSGGLDIPFGDIHSEIVSARLRPYNAEEMKELVGKVISTSEDKTFLVLAHSGNTVLFGEVLHTPEDLTLDIYKLPNGSPCAILEHLENGEWVK